MATAKPIILQGKAPPKAKPTIAGTPRIEPLPANVSVKELIELCTRAREQEAVVDDIKEALKPEADKLKALEDEILKRLELLEMDKFPLKGHGTFFLKSNFSVKVPKVDDDRAAFFAYLKEQGIFDSMITVNSATLNAWYKQEMDAITERAAKGEDVDPDFKIPGIEEPKPYNQLQFRKETKRG